jgi:hypothetical protein
MLHFAKIGGRHWNFSLDADLRDKNFNIDALGFLDRNNVNSYYMGHSYFTTDPIWKFQETNTALNMWYQENPEEEISNEKLALTSGISIGTSITLLNQWSFGLNVSKKLPGYDDFDTRGGYIIEDPGTLSLSSWISPKPGKKVNQQFSIFGGKDDYASKWHGLSYSLELSPREHYSISISPDYAWNYDESQWVDNLYSYPEYIYLGSAYGKLTSQTISLGIRMNYSFTPDMSLQLFTQPFLAIGKYDSYRLLMENKTYQFQENFPFYGIAINDITLTEENTAYEVDDPYWDDYNNHNYDFNTKSLNWQSVFRWEYRPGSVLFFVWSFSSYEDQELLDFNISKSYRKLFEQVATHKFLIKYNYWMKL